MAERPDPEPQEGPATVDMPALLRAGSPGTDAEAAGRRAPRRARRHDRRPMLRISTATLGMSTTILVLIAVHLALIGWRANLVRLLPQTASIYGAIGLPVNLRGLTFENVTTETDVQSGVPVLVVGGRIVNIAGRVIDVPALRLSVRNDHGHEVYAWTAPPPEASLSPGETLPFRSRLASPPHDGKQVLVRFVTRRDHLARVQ